MNKNDVAADYLQTVRMAVWIWIAYQAALVVLDVSIYWARPFPPDLAWNHVFNTLPAFLLLFLSLKRFAISSHWSGQLLLISIPTLAPILLNDVFDPQLSPGPLTNLEGLVLRQLPVLLLGLVLVAWRYRTLVIVTYSIAINLFELLLILILNRLEDPRYFSFIFIMIIRTACLIVVGIFISQLNKNLRNQAMRDSLTGLYNRHYLNELLSDCFNRAGREKAILSVILLDIDFFKRVNDTYGHIAGDVVLRTMGMFLQKHTRKEDVVCRFGGEEFLIVMPGATIQNAMERAEQLRRSLEEMSINHGSQLFNITCSAGVANFPLNAKTSEGVIFAVDEALYIAKQAGRNCVESAIVKL